MDQHQAISPGKTAVITGGASGIGLAVARRLGSAGMRLLLADIDDGALASAANNLRAHGSFVETLQTDVSDAAQVAALKQAADTIGPVSLLMNNAGQEGGGGLLAGQDVWERTIETNLMGAVYGIQQFMPDMLTAKWPCAIVNTGSKQGITLPPGDTAYNVSKAALKALTESLAHDLLETDGRVSAHLLIPGFTYTGFTRRRGVAEKPSGAWTAEQVADFMLAGMAAGDFYILCPDNDVTGSIDERRIAWNAGISSRTGRPFRAGIPITPKPSRLTWGKVKRKLSFTDFGHTTSLEVRRLKSRHLAPPNRFSNADTRSVDMKRWARQLWPRGSRTLGCQTWM